MRLLLDTCSLLWALHAPAKLRPVARRALEDSRNSLHVSPVSFWEISLKTSLGKLALDGVSPDDIPRLVAESGWHIAPLQPETAASFHRLPRFPDHKDPFDRLLIWTAIRENFTLVSRDANFPLYAPLGLQICS